jgi:cobalamin synthase
VTYASTAERIPVVADGFISTSAAAFGCVISPKLRDYLFIGHRSQERGRNSLIELIGQKKIGGAEIIIGSMTLFFCVLLLSWQAALAALLVTGLMAFLSGLYYGARLLGITGDCLGATNQLTEVSLYLTAVILSRFELL